MHHFKLSQIHHHMIAAIYTKNDQEIGAQWFPSVFYTKPAFPHSVIMSNPTTQGLAITMICPDKATSSSLFKQIFHILRLPPTFSATSRYGKPTPHYKDHVVIMHISLDRANLNTINISTQIFTFCNTLIATGLQFTCTNWQAYLKSQLHSSTST